MPRPASVRWCEKRRAYISSVGEVSEKNGRRLPVAFRADDKGEIGKRDKSRATRALDAYLEVRRADVMRPGDYTFGDLCQLYLSHSKQSSAPLTYTGHRKVLRLVCRHREGKAAWGDRSARELTATELDKLVLAWVKLGRKPTYLNRMVASVQAVLNWAAAPAPHREPERLITINPLKGYSSPHTRIPDAPDRYADAEEVAAFFAWARKRARSIKGLTGRFERLTVELLFALSLTGARPGELCGAEWGDVEPRAENDAAGKWWGSITLPPSRWKAGGKTGKSRVIFLPPKVARTVRAIGRLAGHHPVSIWTHRRASRSAERGATERSWGEPWNSNALSRKVKELRRAAIADGVPLQDTGDNRFVAYRLRHTAAANLLMGGRDTYTTGKLLGTSAAMVQRTYGSLTQKHLIDAAGGLVKKREGK